MQTEQEFLAEKHFRRIAISLGEFQFLETLQTKHIKMVPSGVMDGGEPLFTTIWEEDELDECGNWI